MGSNFLKIRRILLTLIGVVLTIFLFYTAALREATAVFQRGFPLLLSYIWILLKIDGKNENENENKIVKVVSNIILIGGALSLVYLLSNYHSIAGRIGLESDFDNLVAIIGTIAVLELGRRTVGINMPLIGFSFLLYGYFGFLVPGVIGHKGFSIQKIARFVYLSVEGIFGFALATVCSFVFIFIIYGVVLKETGGGDFFTDFAYSITKKMRSGPAQAAIIASAFFGTISGSAVANTAATGSFTIPLMKKRGYDPVFTGGVVAAASTGGQIMPPVMGAAAFMMAEVTGIAYFKIIKAAILPALLYYACLMLSVHFQSIKEGLEATKETPHSVEIDEKVNVKYGLYHFISLIVLIVMLFKGYSPAKSGFFAIVTAIAISYIAGYFGLGKYLKLKDYVNICKDCAKTGIPLIVATAVVGTIVAVVTMTGLGNKLSELVVIVSQGNLFIALLLCMIAALVLGMGLPTVASYILVAVVIAPAFLKMGVDLMPAHMFMLYFASLSAITPPVGLASYTAAGIADSPFFPTAWQGCKVAVVAFIVPFMFIYGSPLLLIGTKGEIAAAIVTSFVGIVVLSSAIIGYLGRKLILYERILASVTALLLIDTHGILDLLGFIMIGILIAIYIFNNKKYKRLAQESEAS